MLKAFLAYYRPYRTLFLVDFGCAVLSGLLELGFPIAVKGFIDSLLPRQDWGLILLAAAALALVYVANAGLMVVVTYWGHVLGINIETTLRERAFDHLQKLSFRFYDGQKTGHLVARVTKDLEEIGEVAHHGPEDLFIAVMTLLGAFALMLTVHAPLALITAAILPLIAFVSIRYGGRMTRNWQAQYGRVGAFNARIEENVGGMRVVQAFANEPHERALFARDNARYRDTKLEAYRLMAAGLSINYLGLRLVQIAVLLGGAAFVVRGDLTPGGFVGFLLLVGVFYRPLEKIGAVVETYPKGVAGFRRYQELLATAPDITDRPEARAVEPCGATSASRGSASATAPGARSSPASTSRWLRARRWRSWAPRGSARPPSAPCCRASTRSRRAGSPSTGSTSATSPSRACAGRSASCSRTCSCSPARSGRTSPMAASTPRRRRSTPPPGAPGSAG